jgi:hypothetical protein
MKAAENLGRFTVDFYCVNGPPDPAIGSDYFLAHWTGYFTAPVTGNYQFYSEVDDRCKLWVNSQLVLSSWTVWYGTQMPPPFYSPPGR